MNPLTPYLSAIKAGAFIALLAGSAWSGWEWRDRSADIAVAEARANANEKLAEMAAAEAESQRRVRESEQSKARLIAEIDRGHQEDLANAIAAERVTADDLRAGNARLRSHWQGCIASSRVSGAASSAVIADAAADLRAADTAALVRAGREADDWIKRLQQVTQEDRR